MMAKSSQRPFAFVFVSLITSLLLMSVFSVVAVDYSYGALSAGKKAYNEPASQVANSLVYLPVIHALSEPGSRPTATLSATPTKKPKATSTATATPIPTNTIAAANTATTIPAPTNTPEGSDYLHLFTDDIQPWLERRWTNGTSFALGHDAAADGGRQGFLNLLVNTSGSHYVIASPLVPAPPVPYNIETVVKLNSPRETGDQYGIVFGANYGGGECPVLDFSICFTRYYEMRVRFYYDEAAGKDHMEMKLKRIDSHDANNNGQGPDLIEWTRVGGVEENDFVEWDILVESEGRIEILANDLLVASATDSGYINNSYFGISVRTEDEADAEAKFDYVKIESLTSTATPSPSPSPTPTKVPTVTVFAEDYESETWENKWDVNLDFSASGYKWGARDIANSLDPSSTSVGWAIGGGTNGQNLDPISPDYPAGVQTWLVAGPFDFTGIKNVVVSFDLYYEASMGDRFVFSVSEDRIVFDPQLIVNQNVEPGNAVWQQKTVMLDSYARKPQVWLAFSFDSASAAEKLGVIMDNIMVTVGAK